MAKASYCNYSFVVRLRSYLKNITIVTLKNYNNIICNFKKEEIL
jgi:hypothetical protein